MDKQRVIDYWVETSNRDYETMKNLFASGDYHWGLSLDEKMLDKLELITRFNLSVRYPDYQREFYKICTKEFSTEALQSIDEVRHWLLRWINV